jgi:hypothetical protein
MSRPPLTKHLSPEDFRSFYWLKQELMEFCREHGLATTGSKKDLELRVETCLRTGSATEKPAQGGAPRVKGQMPRPMPLEFRRETVIGPGWRCSQALRAFFEREIGPQFHFNGLMRDFIKHGAGKTLQEAIKAWETEQQPKAAKEIAPQFEYNRHMREYFQAHPGAALPEAIQAWKDKKARRR